MSNELSGIIICTDATGSMGSSMSSIKKTMTQLNCITELLGIAKSELAVFRDYDSGSKGYKFGGVAFLSGEATNVQESNFNRDYMNYPSGGRGVPEAHKTFLNQLLFMREKDCEDQKGNIDSQIPKCKKLVFMYTDAPPHLTYNDDVEGEAERKYLQSRGFIDNWFVLCAEVRKYFRVVTVLTKKGTDLCNIYAVLGEVVSVEENTAECITETTMDIFMKLIGQASNGSSSFHSMDPQYIIETQIEDPSVFNNIKKLTSKTITPLVIFNIRTTLKTAFPKVVLSSFQKLFNSGIVSGLMSNSVIGHFWRRVNGFIRSCEDNKYESQVQTLCNTLSNLILKLPPVTGEKLKKWVEESYDQTGEIRKIQLSKWQESKSFLYLPGNPNISYKVINEVTRGAQNFIEIMEFISLIEIRNDTPLFPEDEELAAESIPLGLTPREVFMLLPHLLSPGMRFYIRGALIVAILSLKNKLLAPLAESFLMEKKGEWINLELKMESGVEKPAIPMNWSVGFMKILKLLPEEFLTEQELKFRDHFLTVCTIRANMSAHINCKMGITSLTSLRTANDYRVLCSGCGISRSFSVIAESGKCGLCVSLTNPKMVSENLICWKSDAPCDKTTEREDGKGNWACCNKSLCRAHYHVTNTEHLNVSSKCHFCRYEDKTAPTVECMNCCLKYVSDGKVAMEAMETALGHAQGEEINRIERALKLDRFICPRCVISPNNTVNEVSVEIFHLMNTNPELKDILPVGPYSALISKQKLNKIVREVEATDSKHGPAVLYHNGFKIINPDDAKSRVLDEILHGSAVETCTMCYDDVSVSKMGYMCGNCSNRVCDSCSSHWYQRTQCGELVSHATMLCPHCKEAPKYAVMKRAHKELVAIRNRKTYTWNPTDHHGWCTTCNNLAPVVARVCAETAPVLKDWECGACKEQKLLKNTMDAPTSKSCPGCGIATVLGDGCNHITCPVVTCGEHWCYVCEEGGFNGESIYNHLDEEHGGYWN
jgi:hypothetical protein